LRGLRRLSLCYASYMGEQAKTEVALRERLPRDLLFVFLVLGLPLGFASAPRTFHDGDTSWHVAAGRWIFAHAQIPTTDPFSFTAAGRPWVAMEWLSDLIYAGVFRLAGYAGLISLVAAALLALHLILFTYLRRRIGPIGLALTIIGMDIVLSPFILARPHVLVWPLLALWTVLLANTVETGRPPPMWTALILTLWANLHGSFPIALVIAGLFALDALIAVQWKTLREWLLFALACLVAICLNANGLAGILQPFRIAQLKSLNLISEWAPSTPHNAPQFYAALVLVLGFLLWRGIRIPIGRLLLLLAMLTLAFSEVRQQSWCAIVAAGVIPPLLRRKADPTGKIAPLALAAVLLLMIRALIPFTPLESVSNPRHLLAAIPADLRGQPVFNEYTFGGPLILSGIKPYIDGRSELYGDAFMNDYVDIANGDWDLFNSAVRRYDIRWTMLPNNRKKLIAELDRSGQWQRIYSDKIGVIHLRKISPEPRSAHQ
jgi:hypothetical protein